MRGVQSETLEDTSSKKYCMRVWARLNAYMLTLGSIYEKIAEEVSSLGALDAPCMLSTGTLTTEYIATDTVSAPRVMAI